MQSLHLTKPFNTPKFKALQRKWYAKLADSGFVDIENTNLDEHLPKAWHNNKWANINPLNVEATKEYFERAVGMVWTYAFSSPIHKAIWILHSRGKSVRDISRAIKGKKKKSQISNIICNIAKEIK